MRPSHERRLEPLRVWGLNLLGLTMLLSLPAIWVSFTGPAMLLILATGAGAAVLYCVLYRFEEIGEPVPAESRASRRARVLDARLLDQLSSLGPYTCHRRMTEADFQRSMAALKAALYLRGRA